MNSKNGVKKLCALCGLVAATTRDHLPPKSIYPSPSSIVGGLHTVPSCALCNNGASVVDEEFKMYISITTGEFRVDSNEVLESAQRTLINNRRLLREVFSTAQRCCANRGGGILERSVSIEFNGLKYYSVIHRIIRGLYWVVHKKSLLPSARIDAFAVQILDKSTVSELTKFIKYLDTFTLNQATFKYKYFTIDNANSFWAISFFDKHSAVVFVENS